METFQIYDTFNNSNVTTLVNTNRNINNIAIDSKNFDDDGLIFLANNYNKLCSISLLHAKISDRGIIALSKTNCNLTKIIIRKEKGITIDEIYDDYSNVTDKSIIPLIRVNNNIIHLSLYGCHITDNTLIALFKNNNSIEHINICKTLVTDIGLFHLCRTNHNIRDIDISYTAITDDGLIFLAENINHVNHINIQGCPITERGIRCILEHITVKMIILNISHESCSQLERHYPNTNFIYCIN